MNEQYLDSLYDWINSMDPTFKNDVDQVLFKTKMSDSAYASSMYDWISEMDPTYKNDVSQDQFFEKIGKKKDSTVLPSSAGQLSSQEAEQAVQQGPLNEDQGSQLIYGQFGLQGLTPTEKRGTETFGNFQNAISSSWKNLVSGASAFGAEALDVAALSKQYGLSKGYEVYMRQSLKRSKGEKDTLPGEALRSFAEEKKKEASEIQYDPNTVTGFLGEIIPSTAGAAAAVLTSYVSAPAAALIGGASTLGLTASSIGSGIQEYDDYKKETGGEIDPAARLGVGILYGAAEFATEKLQMDRFLPKGASKQMLDTFLGSIPKEVIEKEGADLVKKFASESASNSQLVNNLLTGAGSEGFTELLTTVAQEASKYTYYNNDDQSNIFGEGFLGEAVKSFLGGAVMGAGLGPLSYGSQRVNNDRRRKQAGEVVVGRDSETGDSVEIIGRDGDNYSVIKSSGEQAVIPVSRIEGSEVALTYDAFKNILNGSSAGTAMLSEDPDAPQIGESMSFGGMKATVNKVDPSSKTVEVKLPNGQPKTLSFDEYKKLKASTFDIEILNDGENDFEFASKDGTFQSIDQFDSMPEAVSVQALLSMQNPSIQFEVKDFRTSPTAAPDFRIIGKTKPDTQAQQPVAQELGGAQPTAPETVQPQPVDQGVAPEVPVKQAPLPEKTASKLTEDDQGNYVFHHYSAERRPFIKRSDGTGSRATSKEEQRSLSAVGGLAMYYPQEGQVEGSIQANVQHTVVVPKEKVYDADADPLGFEKEARERFEKVRPGQAFDDNYRVAFITQVAGDNGFDMVVAKWKPGQLRAQSTKELVPIEGNIDMKPIPPREYEVGDLIRFQSGEWIVTEVNGDNLKLEGFDQYGGRQKNSANLRFSRRLIEDIEPGTSRFIEQSDLVKKPNKTAKAIAAPLYNTQVKSVEDAARLRNQPEYKAHLEMIQKVADVFGIKINQLEDTIGGYENAAGEKIVELSTVITVADDTNLDRLEEMAAVLASLAPEVQESTIAGRYVEQTDPGYTGENGIDEFVVTVGDMQGALDALKAAEIFDFTLNETERTVTLLDFSKGKDDAINEKLTRFAYELSTRNISYGKQQRHTAESRFIGVERRAEILGRLQEDAVNNAQDQGRAGQEGLLDVVNEAITRDNAFRSEKGYDLIPVKEPEPQAPPVTIESLLNEEKDYFDNDGEWYPYTDLYNRDPRLAALKRAEDLLNIEKKDPGTIPGVEDYKLAVDLLTKDLQDNPPIEPVKKPEEKPKKPRTFRKIPNLAGDISESVNNAAKTIGISFPNVHIIVGENVRDSNKKIREFFTKLSGPRLAERQVKALKTARGFVTFVDGKPISVVLDRTKVRPTTAAHEAWHILLSAAFGKNPSKFRAFQAAISKQLVDAGYQEIDGYLKEFGSRYTGNQGYEEYIVELGGLLATGGIDPSTIDNIKAYADNPRLLERDRTLIMKIKDVINKFSKDLIGRELFLDDATPENILQFMVSISDKIARGQDVSGYVRGGNKPSTTSKEIEVKKEEPEKKKTPKNVLTENKGLKPKDAGKQGLEEILEAKKRTALKELEAAVAKARAAGKASLDAQKAAMAEYIDTKKRVIEAIQDMLKSQVINGVKVSIPPITAGKVNKILDKVLKGKSYRTRYKIDPGGNRVPYMSSADQAIREVYDIIQQVIRKDQLDRARANKVAAKANVKAGKLGVLPTGGSIDQFLQIDPKIVPLGVFDEYMSIIRMIGKTGKAIPLEEKGALSQRIEGVLNEVAIENGLVEQLALAYDNHPKSTVTKTNKATGVTTTVESYSNTVKDMFKNGVISESEMKLMLSRKSDIVSKAPSKAKQPATLTDVQNIIARLLSFPVPLSGMGYTASQNAIVRAFNGLTERDLMRLVKQKKGVTLEVNPTQTYSFTFEKGKIPVEFKGMSPKSRTDLQVNKKSAVRLVFSGSQLIKRGVAIEETSPSQTTADAKEVTDFDKKTVGYDVSELLLLEKVFDNLSNGYVTKLANEMKAKLNGRRSIDEKIAKVIDSYKNNPLNWVSFLKSEIKKKVYRDQLKTTTVKEKLRRTGNYAIDVALNNFENSDVYNELLRPISVAIERKDKEYDNISAEVLTALDSISFKDQFEQNTLVRLIMLHKMHLADPAMPTVQDWIDATMKGTKNRTSVYVPEAMDKIQELANSVKIDDEFDLQSAMGKLSPKGKKLLSTIEKIQQDNLSSKVAFGSTVTRGSRVPILEYYAPTPRVVSGKKDVAAEDAVVKNYVQPSSRASTFYEKTKTAHEISFDAVESILWSARHTLTDFYVTPELQVTKEAVKHLKSLGFEGTKGEAVDAVEMVINDSIEMVLASQFVEQSTVGKISSSLSKRAYQAMLSGIIRPGIELLSNVSFAFIDGAEDFANGIKVLTGKTRPGLMSDAAFNLGTAQLGRMFNLTGGASRFSDSLKDVSYIPMRDEVTGMKAVSKVTQWAGNKFDTFSNTAMSSPDQIVARTVFFGSLANKYKELTGNQIDLEKIADNDQEYMEANFESLKKAVEHADSRVSEGFSSSNPFDGILRNKVTPSNNIVEVAYKSFNGFMNKFLVSEYVTSVKAVNAMIGNGAMSRGDGLKLLLAQSARMITYSYLMELVGTTVYNWTSNFILDMMGIDAPEEEEEEEDEDFLNKSAREILSLVATLAVDRNFGNFAKIGTTTSMELLNEKYGEGITYQGKYNQFEDNITFPFFDTEKQAGEMSTFNQTVIKGSGSLSPYVRNTVDLFNYSDYYRKAKKEETKEKHERNLVLSGTKMLMLVSGIPLYREYNKIQQEVNFKLKEAEEKTKTKP